MPDLRLVELVGPPGAGKSTVFAALRREGVAAMPLLRRRPYRIGFARHLLSTAGALARRGVPARGWTRELFVMAAYLRALPPALRGPRRPPGDTLVFDQGPIYTLARRPLRDERLRDWWEASLRDWRSLLDVVVWLDAPDDVLAARINGRDKAHRYKQAVPAAVAEALAGDRAVYQDLLTRFEAGPGGPAVLRFDTSRRSADDIAAAVLAAGRSR